MLRLMNMDFIMTPYRKVVNCNATDEIVYLTADEEADYNIASSCH